MKPTSESKLILTAAVCLCCACTSEKDTDGASPGGGAGAPASEAAGGWTAAGGTGGIGGSQTAGGSGGSQTTGGTTAQGGSTPTGGTAGEGGAQTTGGTGGQGGSTPTGGVAGTAGSPALGGSTGDGGAAGTGGAAVTCTLTDSGPVAASQDGQIIEELRIVSTGGGPAIDVSGYSNVTIRNVEILHSGGPGISFSNADDITIENVSIEHTGAPASGPNPSDGLINIRCYSSARPTITNARLTRGSSGVYLIQCPDSTLRFLEGYDFRGPFPRGQLVQWDNSDNGVLEDFSVIGDADSWPEDNVNVYQSLNVQIRRGLIDGNNSPSGVGVIFDGGPSTGLVEDVDALHMGNGCFSDYDGGEGIIFCRTRCRDNICGDQGRGVPSSNALMWCGHPDHTALRIEQSAYFAACNPSNIVWPQASFELIELDEIDFTPRAPIQLSFCWE